MGDRGVEVVVREAGAAVELGCGGWRGRVQG